MPVRLSLSSYPDSPFFPDDYPVILPPALAAQLLLKPEDPHTISLHGEMTRVWVRHWWMKPVLWLLSRAGLWLGETGEHIPAHVVVRVTRDEHGIPHHIYRRTLSFDPPQTFVTDTTLDPRSRRAIDAFGPGLRLFMAWQVNFMPPHTLNLKTDSFGVRMFGRYWSLPGGLAAWLIGTADFVQKAMSDDHIAIDLVIRHPLLGELFGYEGTFQVLTHAKEAQK